MNNDAFQAYIRIKDNPNKIQRRKLLKAIITDPSTCYLFIQNCRTDNLEFNKAFNKVLESQSASYSLYISCKDDLKKKHQNKLLENILSYSLQSHDLVMNCKDLPFKIRYRIYRKYHDLYNGTNNSVDFLNYCKLFYDCINKEEKYKLIELVKDHGILLKRTLNSKIRFNNEMRDTLEAYLLAHKLVVNN